MPFHSDTSSSKAREQNVFFLCATPTPGVGTWQGGTSVGAPGA